MAYPASSSSSHGYGDFSGLRAEGREPGARRKKIAGYLKAANELRQHYFSEDPSKDQQVDGDDSVWADAAVIRKGNEEMILFPSYARRHVKSKPAAEPGTMQEVPGTGRDYRDTAGTGDSEFWRQEWERYEDDNAVVDVDVRGWIYSPHRGPTTRKQRLMIGLARQLSGIPAPPATGSGESSMPNSRPGSPTRRQDEELVQKHAETILRRGQQEAEAARRGAFSEEPGKGSDSASLYSLRSESPDRGRPRPGDNRLSRIDTEDTTSPAPSQGIVSRASWNTQPTKMTHAELHHANTHMLNRLKPFMANPLANTAISAFFYNEAASRQRTVHTDTSGHFTLRAALDFVPTHVRILAGENLSATEEVNITEAKGISLISDIDDTVKHSAITMGPREIFRNAFTRDLGDLTVDGVKEWYTCMQDLGVKIHYVSNSPWQMYPVLTSFFSMAGLPKGSFHLKQYSGMLQGIFEPVAERKKGNLDRIMRDFPDRKFILVGDSGEADLEVYTEVALENPGKIAGIFIRDVTTTSPSGYFDPSHGAAPGGVGSRHHSRHDSGEGLAMSKRLSRPNDVQDDERELQAAIAASLADMEAETRHAVHSIHPDRITDGARHSTTNGRSPKPSLPPRRRIDAGVRSATSNGLSTADHEEDLIDFSDDLPPSRPHHGHSEMEQSKRDDSGNSTQRIPRSRRLQPPPPPAKPRQLRSPSPPEVTVNRNDPDQGPNAAKTPPPRPRKPSSAVKPHAMQATVGVNTGAAPARPSPLAHVQRQDSVREAPALPTRPPSYKEKFVNMLPRDMVPSQPGTPRTLDIASTHFNGRPPHSPSAGQRGLSTTATRSVDDLRGRSSRAVAPPPPPVPRRTGTAASGMSTASAHTAYSTSANRRSGAYDNWDAHSRPGARPSSSPSGSRPSSEPTTPGADGVSRKEQLWQQRVIRARQILEPKGVTFRTWRVGSDVADICVKLVEMELRRIKREKSSPEK